MSVVHEVVKAGDVVRVTVTEVDIARKRIGLTMRKDGGAAAKAERDVRDTGPRGKPAAKPAPRQMQAAPKQSAPSGGALGAALLDAMRKR